MENTPTSFEAILKTMGLLGGVLMPVFNIPLIIRIVRRKTSKDISLTWVLGVWTCMVMMVPSSLISNDMVLRSFCISNVALFSIVVLVVLIYHRDPQ